MQSAIVCGIQCDDVTHECLCRLDMSVSTVHISLQDSSACLTSHSANDNVGGAVKEEPRWRVAKKDRVAQVHVCTGHAHTVQTALCHLRKRKVRTL